MFSSSRLTVPLLFLSTLFCAIFSGCVATERAPDFGDAIVVGEPLAVLGLGRLRDLAYSSDGKILASAGGDGVVLWNPDTGEMIRAIGRPGHFVNSLAFSPDDSLILTGSTNDTARLWNARTRGTPNS